MQPASKRAREASAVPIDADIAKLFPASHQPMTLTLAADKKLQASFTAKQAELKKAGIVADETWAFHGTYAANIPLIVANGFDIRRVGKSSADNGWYGKGIYLTANPLIAMQYTDEKRTMLLCRVLLGRELLVDSSSRQYEGRGLEQGYDSHVVGKDRDEIVIFDAAQILPCYVCNM